MPRTKYDMNEIASIALEALSQGDFPAFRADMGILVWDGTDIQVVTPNGVKKIGGEPHHECWVIESEVNQNSPSRRTFIYLKAGSLSISCSAMVSGGTANTMTLVVKDIGNQNIITFDVPPGDQFPHPCPPLGQGPFVVSSDGWYEVEFTLTFGIGPATLHSLFLEYE